MSSSSSSAPLRSTVSGALAAGRSADKAQQRMRVAQQMHTYAVKGGSESMRRAAARLMLKNAVLTVIRRNRELTQLGQFVATADVATPRDGTYFWSGDARRPDSVVTASAMVTAQEMALEANARTVEQTHGGGQLDTYAGHANSFGYLAERFKYLGNSPLRAALIQRGAKRVGPALSDPLNRGTAAGSLWDVMSVRFAAQARGRVDVVHAAPSKDSYFSSPAYANSTWLTKERPTLQQIKRTHIVERFGEDLQGQLRPPRGEAIPDWRGTGGFRANLRGAAAVTPAAPAPRLRSKL